MYFAYSKSGGNKDFQESMIKASIAEKKVIHFK